MRRTVVPTASVGAGGASEGDGSVAAVGGTRVVERLPSRAATMFAPPAAIASTWPASSPPDVTVAKPGDELDQATSAVMSRELPSV